MGAILAEAMEHLDNPDTGARAMDSGPEYGAALNQAVEAKASDDGLRYALMTGFVTGLPFNNPGPVHPDHGMILEAVVMDHETVSDESLQYVRARMVCRTGATPLMSRRLDSSGAQAGLQLSDTSLGGPGRGLGFGMTAQPFTRCRVV